MCVCERECEMYAYLSLPAGFYVPLHLFVIRVSIPSCAPTHVAMCECVFTLKSVCVFVPTGLIRYQIPFVLGAH